MTLGPKSETAVWAPALGSTMFEGFCRTFFSCYCPLTVEGQGYLPEGPFLLCSNHCSHMDSAALMTASRRSFRHFALLGASDYFFRSGNIRRLVAPFMNIIAIDRRPGPKSLAVCLETCRRFLDATQGALIMYPEGTRSPDGEMQSLKAGAGLFAVELGVPLIPAYVEGTHHALPKGQTMPRPGRVKVRFGEAMAFATAPLADDAFRERRRCAVEQLGERIRLLRPDPEKGQASEAVSPSLGAAKFTNRSRASGGV